MTPVEALRRIRVPGFVLLGLGFAVPSAHGQQAGGEASPKVISAHRSGIFTADPSTTEGALRLLIPMGARAVGMGRAVTAFQGQESAFWNPAGLARIENGRFVVLRRNGLAGEATAFSLILARQPLGTITLSYQFLDLGDQDYVDKDQNVLGTISNRDHLGIISFASQLLPWLDTGLNFKVYQSRTTCQGECPTSGPIGTTYLLDAGLLAFPLPDAPFRLGVMVAHAGPDLQIINVEQADPPPTRLRVAAAYEVLNHFLPRDDMQIWTTAELEDRLLDLGEPILYLGAEFVAGNEDQIMVRAGYGQGQTGQPAGVAMGLGLRYQQFEFGIGKALSGASLTGDSEPAQITFGVIF